MFFRKQNRSEAKVKVSTDLGDQGAENQTLYLVQRTERVDDWILNWKIQDDSVNGEQVYERSQQTQEKIKNTGSLNPRNFLEKYK